MGHTAKLSERTAKWASDRVASRKFGSTDDVVNAAMEMMADQEADLLIDWDRAGSLAAVGEAEIARGEFIEIPDCAALEAFFDDMGARTRIRCSPEQLSILGRSCLRTSNC